MQISEKGVKTMAECDGKNISSRIELISDGRIRMALLGLRAAGKTTLAKALLPSVEAVGTGSHESLAQADVLIYVHDLQQSCLSREEVDELRVVAEMLCSRGQKNLVLIGTHRDCLSVDYGNKALEWLAAAVKSIIGFDIPSFGVSGSLWSLAKCESEFGRKIAASCFRESSGVDPILGWIEGVRWRLQSPGWAIADRIANKVVSALAQRLSDGEKIVTL